ncbi:MAG TPA: hypothetical protein VLA54_12250, partial [Acidimicrobiia bacterium]|nr:hypothetical protein [Acidimicrobiia bacterium]
LLAVVSDHVQDTVDGPGIDLRSHLPDEVVVVEEGSAALVSGLAEASILGRIDGVEGWQLVPSGAVLTWCGRGRYFGPFAEPFFRGIHGGAHTRTQLALVSGGHPARRGMASAVAGGPVPAAYWAPALARAMGRAALPDPG